MTKEESWDKIEAHFKTVLEMSNDNGLVLSEDDVADITGWIDHREYGIALEYLLDALMEDNAFISQAAITEIDVMIKMMEMENEAVVKTFYDWV